MRSEINACPFVGRISGVQVHDSVYSSPLVNQSRPLNGCRASVERSGKLYANRAYASQMHRDWLRRGPWHELCATAQSQAKNLADGVGSLVPLSGFTVFESYASAMSD